MCNATNKTRLHSFVAATAAFLSLSACGDKDADAAGRLVAQAQASLDRGDYDSAFIYLDSLSAAYPRHIEAGRRGLALRPRAIEGRTNQEIIELQCYLQAHQATADSLIRLFTATQPSEDVFEGYYMANDAPKNFRERNTAVARLTPSGEFYIISSLAGRTTQHTAISLTADGRTATSGHVPFDPESMLSRESVRFSAEKADTIGSFACSIDHLVSSATLKFIGGKKTQSATLSAKEIHAIADTYRLSRSLSAISSTSKRLEQLKAKLQLARDQQARQSE